MGNDTFTATGRSEYRFRSLDDGASQLILFDQEGDGTADYYLVVENASNDIFDTSMNPVSTNLLNASDFAFDYEVGTAADDTLSGLAGVPFTELGGRMYGFGGDDRLYGSGSDDYINGGDGDDRLDGGGSIYWDTMVGGAGDDIYFVSRPDDNVIEEASGGSDLVNSSGDYALGDHVESLTLTGTAVWGIGNSLDNEITGNSVTNVLEGDLGNDTISGAGGADSIRGGAGNDWIRGGEGGDLLIGGSGADKFAYYSISEIGGAGTGPQDVIMGFAGTGSDAAATDRDRIDLHRIDADVTTEADDAFHFIGDDEFTGVAGELRVVSDWITVTDPINGAEFEDYARLVEGDVNGDGAADFQLAVIRTRPLQDGDFYLEQHKPAGAIGSPLSRLSGRLIACAWCASRTGWRAARTAMRAPRGIVSSFAPMSGQRDHVGRRACDQCPPT
jgi:Ca2+-binding RTX toxin-like protein